MSSGGQRTLQPRNGRRLSPHALSHLRLGKSCFVPRPQKLVEEFTFFPLDSFDFLADARPAEQLRNNLIMSFHL
jgi:hypothetical protein